MSTTRDQIIAATNMLFVNNIITGSLAARLVAVYDSRHVTKPFGPANVTQDDDLEPNRDPRAGGMSPMSASTGNPDVKVTRFPPETDGGGYIGTQSGAAQNEAREVPQSEQLANFLPSTVVDRTSLVSDKQGRVWWVDPTTRRVWKATVS